jgi:starvation-inducible DNA-binding protein
MRTEKPELVEALAHLLGDTVVLYTKAHGHHWNVTGRDFSQFHDFFEEIYSDVLAQFDPVAENMRKMGALAPYRIEDFLSLSAMSDAEVGSDALLMCQDLLEANNLILQSINAAFKIASELDEQGIADYLAGRDDAHKKLRWKLTSYLSPTQADSLAKSEPALPVSVDMTDVVVPVVEQIMSDADGCPLCGYGECMCPSSDGGVCLCDEDCACHNCHVVMDEESYAFQDQYLSFQEEQLDAMMAAGIIVAEEQDLAKALLEIAETHGKFNEDRTGIWAGYTPAAENEYKEIGVKCINCVLYEGPGVCKIIAQPIEDDGKCRFAVIPDGVVKVADEQIVAAGSKPAPKKDRIYGSKKNKPGSAAGSKKIVFSSAVEKGIANKVSEHNKSAKPGRKATVPMLKAVYRRGAGAFSSSHRPGKTRDQWAMARVNAFLKLLRSGSPANPNYKQDNDLLPKAHPRSSRAEASLINHELLQVALKSASEYGSPEHAIYSMAEYSGMGYEVIPALRGAWLRGVRDGDIPFERAYELATKLYTSKDADLLPKKSRKVTGE